jgi:dephospho-CoA kinase
MFRLIGVDSVKIIGLTGGIGSGKSTVAGLLIELGAVIIDADKIGHEVLDTDSQAREQVVTAFGQRILNTDGSVNRRELGRIVFADRNSLPRLNQIMHPLIYRVVKTNLERYKEQVARVVVIEAPLLIEASWATMVDAVWVVTATEANVLKRLEKTGLSRNEIMARIRSQLTESERIKIADVVINNDYSFDELKLNVNGLWQGLQFDSRKQ